MYLTIDWLSSAASTNINKKVRLMTRRLKSLGSNGPSFTKDLEKSNVWQLWQGYKAMQSVILCLFSEMINDRRLEYD